MMLQRFAEGGNFGEYGGRETNVRLLPFIVNVLHECLDARDSRDRRAAERVCCSPARTL